MTAMTVPALPSAVEQVPHGRTARRLEWQHLPPEVRGLVERRLGWKVAEARSQGAGFTPGFASLLHGPDGERAFVKAAGKRAQKQFAQAYLTEADLNRRLPDGLPAPRLLWVEETADWVVLAFEPVDGRNPRRPWSATHLDACLDALEQVADVMADATAGLELRPVTEDLPALLTGWDAVGRTSPDWPHLDEAANLALAYRGVPDQDRFVHFDARDDNFILDASGRALLCDWNWPGLGPAWLDTVHLLVSAYGDGVDADGLLAERRLTRDVAPEHVDAAIAGLTGFMVASQERPAPSSSPFLQVHARWYAAAGWSWLAHRRGWA